MQGHGSGFFVSPDGWALTNAHVVDQGDVVRVRLVDGRELWARVARRHPIRDVALLRVVGQGLAAVPIRPTLARVSETTYAVGTPVDRDLGQTVSQGIISAWRPGDRHGMDVYQATTPIHSGNSGGPLVDAWGNVVAITVSTIRGGGAMGSSLSFFIPVHDALRHLGVVIQPAPAAPQPPAFMPHPMPPAMASPMVPSMGLPMTTPMPPGFGGMTAHPGPAATPPWSAPGTRRGAPSISTPPPLDPRVAPVDAPASLSIPPPPGGAPLEAPPPPAATVPDRVTPGRVPLL
nr:trypsin-like peptidase domain-containing protein [Roseospira visakhapatnamensis]